MTVRDEVASENAMDPNGRSGCQWAAWDAMWSPFDLERAAPRPLCDPATGEIDPVTVEAWSRHDIARRFTKDPARIGRILEDRVRILCGTRDSYYLQRAVARLKAKVEAWKSDAQTRGAPIPEGDGSIELIDGSPTTRSTPTHRSVSIRRWWRTCARADSPTRRRSQAARAEAMTNASSSDRCATIDRRPHPRQRAGSGRICVQSVGPTNGAQVLIAAREAASPSSDARAPRCPPPRALLPSALRRTCAPTSATPARTSTQS